MASDPEASRCREIRETHTYCGTAEKGPILRIGLTCVGIVRGGQTHFLSARRSPPEGSETPSPAQASTDSSSLLSAFFLERILLTHFDVVRSRYVALSMPNAVSKLPYLAAGVITAAG